MLDQEWHSATRGKKYLFKKSFVSDSPFETVESRQHVNDAFRSGIPALKRCPNIWQKFYGIYLNKIGENYLALALQSIEKLSLSTELQSGAETPIQSFIT